MPAPTLIRVLLVDDDEEDYLITRDLFEEITATRYELTRAETYKEGLEKLATKSFDVCITDHLLGGFNGLDLMAKARGAGCHLPFILLTGVGDSSLDQAALKAGASDYLVKGQITPILLDRSVRYALERKRMDEARRESEDRFRMVADAVPVLIWMTDADGHAIFFNQSWLDFTGRPSVHERGEGWQVDIHPEDRDRVVGVRLNAHHQHQPFEVEYRLRRFDGDYRWVLDTGSPRFQAAGVFSGFVGSCVDITDRKRMEDGLTEALDKAVATSRLKSEFLAN